MNFVIETKFQGLNPVYVVFKHSENLKNIGFNNSLFIGKSKSESIKWIKETYQKGKIIHYEGINRKEIIF